MTITTQEIGALPSNMLHRLSTMASGPHQSTPPAEYAARRRFADLAAMELHHREGRRLPWHLRKRANDGEGRDGDE